MIENKIKATHIVYTTLIHFFFKDLHDTKHLKRDVENVSNTVQLITRLKKTLLQGSIQKL